MKKFLIVLFTMIILISFVGCSKTDSTLSDVITNSNESIISSVEITSNDTTKPSPTECNHTWIDATCEALKHCSKCNAVEGTTLEHKWISATCTSPQKCELCNVTEGNALGHQWANATYDRPKHCMVCGVESGEPLSPYEEFYTLARAAKETLLTELKNPQSLQIHRLYGAYMIDYETGERTGDICIIFDYSAMNSLGGYNRNYCHAWYNNYGTASGDSSGYIQHQIVEDEFLLDINKL